MDESKYILGIYFNFSTFTIKQISIGKTKILYLFLPFKLAFTICYQWNLSCGFISSLSFLGFLLETSQGFQFHCLCGLVDVSFVYAGVTLCGWGWCGPGCGCGYGKWVCGPAHVMRVCVDIHVNVVKDAGGCVSNQFVIYML